MLANFLKPFVEHPAHTAGLLIICGLALDLAFLVAIGVSRLVEVRRRAALQSMRLELAIERAGLEIKSASEAKSAWNGIRKFSVEQKVRECDDTFSFYLKPHDGKPLPHFLPGQYLTFQLTIPGLSKPISGAIRFRTAPGARTTGSP